MPAATAAAATVIPHIAVRAVTQARPSVIPVPAPIPVPPEAPVLRPIIRARAAVLADRAVRVTIPVPVARRAVRAILSVPAAVRAAPAAPVTLTVREPVPAVPVTTHLQDLQEAAVIRSVPVAGRATVPAPPQMIAAGAVTVPAKATALAPFFLRAPKAAPIRPLLEIRARHRTLSLLTTRRLARAKRKPAKRPSRVTINRKRRHRFVTIRPRRHR